MTPNCYNRPPFKDDVKVQDGWNLSEGRYMKFIPFTMSKGCQQHGPLGEATLHPDKWDCEGCRWKPENANG